MCASFVATLLPAEYRLVSSRVSSHARHTHRALLLFDTDFTGGDCKHFHCRVPPRLHHTHHAINMCHASELNAPHALARTEYARTRLTQSHNHTPHSRTFIACHAAASHCVCQRCWTTTTRTRLRSVRSRHTSSSGRARTSTTRFASPRSPSTATHSCHVMPHTNATWHTSAASAIS